MSSLRSVKVLLLEPYYGGSHKYWADNLVKFSSHKVELLTLPPRFWKWRMRASSITLFEYAKPLLNQVDLIICSSLMNVSLFRSLVSLETSLDIPIIYYLHENQLTYPISSADPRPNDNLNYGFDNYTSCLSANKILFNSKYHYKEFFDALKVFLKRLPDFRNLNTIDLIKAKSMILGVGIDLTKINTILAEQHIPKSNHYPILLWNHRWESDKNPKLFLQLCNYLSKQNCNFGLIITGKTNPKYPKIFDDLLKIHNSRIVFQGYPKSYNDYINIVSKADIIPITSNQDFYGISFLEAMFCGLIPLIPTNRVYQQHFIDNLNSNCLYTNEAELFEKCYHIINNINAFKLLDYELDKTIDLQNSISRFDELILGMST